MGKLITDGQSLNGATSRFGHAIKTYDDGYGPLFIHRDSMGITGIVRAATWEDAYSICEDEIFPEADETIEEIRKEYNFIRRQAKIIKPLDGGPERGATEADYPLAPGQFVRWETIETPCEDENGFFDNELFQEAFGMRNNSNPKDTKTGFYAKDLNGDRLDLLTPELVAELEITLDIETDSE